MKFYFYCLCLILLLNFIKSNESFNEDYDDDDDDDENLDEESFIEDKKCDKYCCGGCSNRYCCSDKKEAINNQNDCLNNYDPSSPSLIPIKKRSCDSYYDQYGNLIPNLYCEENKFCCGTCFNRTCDDKEYKWLDQTICPNQITNPSTTISSTKHKKSTKRQPQIKHLNRIVSLSVAGIVLAGVILFGIVIYKKFFLKNRKIEKNVENGETDSCENDKPPPYPGY